MLGWPLVSHAFAIKFGLFVTSEEDRALLTLVFPAIECICCQIWFVCMTTWGDEGVMWLLQLMAHFFAVKFGTSGEDQLQGVNRGSVASMMAHD